MAPKKKASNKEVNKGPEVELSSREGSSTEFGFNLTGNIEADFPEYLASLGVNPPPKVQMIKVSRDEEDESAMTGDERQSVFERQKPRLFCHYREEVEGKNVSQVITQIWVKNFLFGTREAKVLSRCMATLKELEVVAFVRAGVTAEALECVAIPSTVRFLFIHLNHADASLWKVAANKGVAHLCLQSNSISGYEVSELATVLKTNDSLLTLNLSNNPIGDLGVSLIAASLVENAKLASLSLSNCRIGDESAAALCRVLARRVEMRQEEVVVWRRRRMEVIVASNSSLQLPAANAHSKQQKRPGSEHSQTGAVGTDKGRKTRKTTTGKDDKKEKSKRKSQMAVSQANPEVKNSRLSPKEISVPDETGIERTDGKMYSAGNRSLHNLNLSRNQMSFDAMLEFVRMLEEHARSEMESKTASTNLQQLSLAKNQKCWAFPEATKSGETVAELLAACRLIEQQFPKYGDVIRGVEFVGQSDSSLNISRESLRITAE